MTPELLRATGDLSWFFESGVCAFERSIQGDILERALNFSPKWATVRGHRVRAMAIRETRQSGAVEPDNWILIKYGEVSRRLEQIAELDPRAARALAFAYGIEGAKYARHRRGRAVALFKLVPSGMALIERARRLSIQRGRENTLNDDKIVSAEIALDDVLGVRDLQRHRMVLRATVEATLLLADAMRLWVKLTRQKKKGAFAR